MKDVVSGHGQKEAAEDLERCCHDPHGLAEDLESMVSGLGPQEVAEDRERCGNGPH